MIMAYFPFFVLTETKAGLFLFCKTHALLRYSAKAISLADDSRYACFNQSDREERFSFSGIGVGVYTATGIYCSACCNKRAWPKNMFQAYLENN